MAPSTPSSGAGACFNDIDLARWTYQQCREKCRELGLTSTGLHSQLRYRLSKWRTSQSDVTGHHATATPQTHPLLPLETRSSFLPCLPTTLPHPLSLRPIVSFLTVPAPSD